MPKLDAGPNDTAFPTKKKSARHHDVSKDLIRAANDCVADLADLIKLVKTYKLTKYEKLY